MSKWLKKYLTRWCFSMNSTFETIMNKIRIIIFRRIDKFKIKIIVLIWKLVITIRIFKFQCFRKFEFRIKITHKIKIIDRKEILRQIFQRQMCFKKSILFASIIVNWNILTKIILIRRHHEKRNWKCKKKFKIVCQSSLHQKN